MRAWLDTAKFADVPRVVSYDDSPVLLGVDLDSGAHAFYLHGMLDDVRIWNTALPEVDIVTMAAP